ncbi:peptide/nickel transport system substrate-binding protein [Enhydrobacter aerosaccus]|uniref:Peptide/nickel transport system substrate-binding protein n=2 Tax=Enhydrobacter aerosaccus TaxID=225324 RepID=A0A1T4P3B0_9HYPH|nr:peptide/nickel transport system substrate-binding protein [Enhydrobacter aerosaccus]
MRPLIMLGSLLAALVCASPVFAQKSGGILKMYHRDNPPSASIHEEATNSTVVPFMAVFNNLVLYDQSKPQNSPDDIVPDLADSWSWSADGKDLTFKLHPGVKWHDGQPFTAEDVVCTLNLLTGKGEDKLRRNPRLTWYTNVDSTSTNGDLEVTIHLKRPQPSFLSLLASGYSPIYPCHIPSAQMRTKPIGTGPFKFVEFKQNEGIKLTRNPDYWKKGRPYLDGIEFTIVPNRATAILSFVSGRFDITFPWEVTIPLLKDVKTQAPNAVCQTTSMNNSTNLIINRDAPPFDNPELRQALSLAIDRKAFVDIINQGDAQLGGVMQPPTDGVWGLPADILATIPGYGPDVAANREKARALLKKAGYGPDKPMKLKIATRGISLYKDPAVILASQLKEVGIDADVDIIETSQWYPKIARKQYSVGLNTTGNGVDDPDQNYFENFSCKSERNYTGYCNPEIETLMEQQSAETDKDKRRKLVNEIDRKLLEDNARPMIMWNRAAICMQPYVKGYVAQVNSVYNGFRFEDVWLDK